MKKFSLCILAITICAAVSAQPFRNFIGKETAQEYAYSVSQAADSSYIIGAKYTNTFLGTGIPAIVNVNKNGFIKWVKQVNINNLPSVYSTWAEAINTRSGKPDGSIMLISVWNSFYLVRLQTNGAILWSRRFTHANFLINNACMVKPFYDANNTLSGFYILGNHYNHDGSFLIKTDVTGVTTWQKKFVHPAAAGTYWLKDFKVTADGGCIITGNQGGANVSALPVVFKISSAGGTTWAKSYQFNAEKNCTADGITITNDGYAITGSFKSNNNLTFKIKTDGSLTWSSFYSTADTKVSYTAGIGIAADAQGNLVIAGSADNAANNKPAILFKLTPAGSVVFTRKLNAEISYYEATLNSIIITNTGNYCAAGTSAGHNTTSDIYMLNLSAAGGSNVSCRPTSFIFNAASTPLKTVSTATPASLSEIFSNASTTAATISIATAENHCGTTAFAPEENNTAAISVSNDLAGQRLLINFKTNSTGNYKAVLINNFGRQVSTVNIIPGQPVFISMHNMNNGIYTVAVKHNENIIVQDKAVWVK